MKEGAGFREWQARTELLEADGNVLRGKHRRVGRGLIAVSLDLHAARDAHEGLAARHISHVHERVVERREDARDAEHLRVARTGQDRSGELFRPRAARRAELPHAE